MYYTPDYQLIGDLVFLGVRVVLVVGAVILAFRAGSLIGAEAAVAEVEDRYWLVPKSSAPTICTPITIQPFHLLFKELLCTYRKKRQGLSQRLQSARRDFSLEPDQVP